ncbi:MAG: ABC transporter substrate-binding protein, partial [Chloroflexota bacterium]
NTQPDISGGPYILDSWTPDESQNFHANPTYFDGAPKIPFLVNKVIGDHAVAVQAIQSGDIDYTYFQGDLFQQIADKSKLQYKSFSAVSVNFLALNFADPNNPQPAYDADGKAVAQTPHPLFSDPIVRKAVAMGFDIDQVLLTLGTDGGTPLVGPVSPTLGWAYANDLQRYPYDPAGALKLLNDDGWTDSDGDGILDKNGVKLEFTIKYSDILHHFATSALIVQSELQNLNQVDPNKPDPSVPSVGFKVNLDLIEWGSYLNEVYYGQSFDMTAMSNSNANTPDPNDFMTLLDSKQDVPGSGNNIVSYINPEMDKLIDEARTVPGCKQEDRAAIYYKIQQLSHDDVTYDWTYVPNIFQVANSRVGNFNPGPSWVFYGYPYYINEWTLGS